MSEAMADAIERANNDRAIGAIVVTGEGRGFCAGADIEHTFKSRIDGKDPGADTAGGQGGLPRGLDEIGLARADRGAVLRCRDAGCESRQRDKQPIADALTAGNIPFFFATGNECLDAGGSHNDRKFLKKPFELADLERVFRDVLSVETNDRKTAEPGDEITGSDLE